MVVISHRGYWKTPTEKNLPVAFERSFSLGFGTETDVRDHLGHLVISHDPPTGSPQTFDDFLHTARKHCVPLALNVKADGLAEKIRAAMADYPALWFVFDMSVPDMRHHLAAGSPVYARISEVERNPPWIDRCAGVWLDAFEGEWYDVENVKEFLDAGLRVCIVSPELHGRTHEEAWARLRPLHGDPRVMLCTDLPEHAKAFFSI